MPLMAISSPRETVATFVFASGCCSSSRVMFVSRMSISAHTHTACTVQHVYLQPAESAAAKAPVREIHSHALVWSSVADWSYIRQELPSLQNASLYL